MVLSTLRVVLDANPDPAFAADAQGIVTYVNPAAHARWGDAVGRTASSLIPNIAPGHVHWGEQGPGGVRVWFAVTVTAFANGYYATCADVTELKRSEERLRRSEELMVDTQGTAHLGTWEWAITQPTATWSAELYRIYGLTPETYTPSYEKYLTMVHPDDRQRVIDATNRVFHEHVPYSHDERIFRPDGSIRYLHTWAHPVLDNDGKLVRLVGVCQDVTDQKLAEEAVRALNVDLERRVAERTQTIERSIRDLEAFNSMVSHDLRAPLAVIQIATDLLDREKELPPRMRTNVTRVQRAVQQMNALVENLLGLARVGHAELRGMDVDVSQLCREIVENLRASSPREAHVQIEPGITCTADAGLMRAALTNVLSNAWKFTSQRPVPTIAVGLTEQNALFVRDNGVGFDMKDAPRLFSPFQRLHREEDFSGTGVGLATVHRIVERHGGRIRAEGQPDAGATFFIELPTLRR